MSFIITIEVEDAQLTAAEIWPDGDHPADPTAEAAAAEMRDCGSPMQVLRDWCLLSDQDLRVTITDDHGHTAVVWS